MGIPISVLRAASKAAREGAAAHFIDPVTATRAVNDTVREGIANLIPTSAITSALKGSTNALKTAKPPRAGSNSGGFYEDALHHMDFLDLKRQAPKAAGEYKLPRVPRGTVSASKAMSPAQKRAMVARKRKAGPKGGMR